ncbi:MAG: molybdenum cofactor guanylyltransferase [Pyrinomonadaceae bacterium]
MSQVKDRPDGFVLAGGASSRMGVDKSGALIGGETLASRAARILSTVAGRVAVVGAVAGETTNFEVIPDRDLDGAGWPRRASLVGLATALAYAATDWTVVLACDLPLVTPALLERLASSGGEAFDAVVPVQPDGRTQPLCALYRRDVCLARADEQLASQNWSLQGLLEGLRVRRVAFAEIADLAGSENFFLNVNTPDDLATARAIVRSMV